MDRFSALSRIRHWRCAHLAGLAFGLALALAALVGPSKVEAARSFSVNSDEGSKRVAKEERREHKAHRREAKEDKPSRKHAHASRKHARSAKASSDDDQPRRRRGAERHTRSASRGSDSGRVNYLASGGCLPGELRSVVSEVSRYGSVTVNSTGRNHSHNASVGGAKNSYHLGCRAVDLRVHGNVSAAASFLRNHSSVGGFHHYGGGLFHIDNGPRRTW